MVSAQIQQQLEMAQRVQAALVPKSRVSTNVDFAVRSTAAGYVGGDICDVFETDRGRTAMILGDVCGKGMAAALLMGLIYGAVRSSCWTGSTRDHEDSVERLNDLFVRKTSADRFATLFSSYYEPETSMLRYINAGHLPMMLFRRRLSGEVQVELLENGGPLLGIVEWGNYRQSATRIGASDLLIMFSDGIVEAMNPQGDQFGQDRLIDAVTRSFDSSPAEIRNRIVALVEQHAGAEPADDQTLIVARFQNVCPYDMLTSLSDVRTDIPRGVDR